MHDPTLKMMFGAKKENDDFLNSFSAKSILAGEKLVATYSIST
jgi:hypothetical protein